MTISYELVIEFINNTENKTVEFKRNVDAVKQKSLVSFANSGEGGVILVGIDEMTVKGKQRGNIVGCEVSDRSKLLIQDRALKCIPPINIDISEMAIKGKDIYVIEVPSSLTKPHCTGDGRYLIRGNGATISLDPNNLLNFYIDIEGRKFVDRFKDATQRLDHDLAALHLRLLGEFNTILKSVDEFKSYVEMELKSIIEISDNA